MYGIDKNGLMTDWDYAVWNFCEYKKHAATFSKLQRIKNMFN